MTVNIYGLYLYSFDLEVILPRHLIKLTCAQQSHLIDVDEQEFSEYFSKSKMREGYVCVGGDNNNVLCICMKLSKSQINK